MAALGDHARELPGPDLGVVRVLRAVPRLLHRDHHAMGERHDPAGRIATPDAQRSRAAAGPTFRRRGEQDAGDPGDSAPDDGCGLLPFLTEQVEDG